MPPSPPVNATGEVKVFQELDFCLQVSLHSERFSTEYNKVLAEEPKISFQLKPIPSGTATV